jgi:hypothetical protein
MAVDEGMAVDEVIGEVKDALIEAGVTGANHVAGLRVASIRLILKVVATQAAGGRVNFHVPFIGTEFAVGASRRQENTHSIDITLAPPGQTESPGVRSGSFQGVLVEAVGRVRQTIASAADGKDPWYLTDATVDISFGVTKEGTISVGAEGSLTSETTNTLRLTLSPDLQRSAPLVGGRPVPLQRDGTSA